MSAIPFFVAGGLSANLDITIDPHIKLAFPVLRRALFVVAGTSYEFGVRKGVALAGGVTMVEMPFFSASGLTDGTKVSLLEIAVPLAQDDMLYLKTAGVTAAQGWVELICGAGA